MAQSPMVVMPPPAAVPRALRICPDEARELIMDWLIPLTENGSMDELVAAFVKELSPYVAEAAQRALRRTLLAGDPEMIITKLHGFLGELDNVLHGLTLNPDMMAVADASHNELVEANVKLRDWVFFLKQRKANLTRQADVAPSTNAVLEKGGVP